MTLLVQDYLRAGNTLEQLTETYGIRVTRSEEDPLVILNYDQIASPKQDVLARECRGLCLEVNTWDVVARSFPRFFNAGELPEVQKEFDWNDFTAESKEDGSLLLLYCYKDEWRVNTRGSFAQGEICPGVNKTWEEVFWQTIGERASANLKPNWTYVFELCSPFNKVVRRYEKPTLFLLAAFRNRTGREMCDLGVDVKAEELGTARPSKFAFDTLEQVREYLEENAKRDPTFEGLVLRDWRGTRLKVKSSKYVALHHLRGEGDNIFNPKYLLPFVLAENGEEQELLTYFPEVRSAYEALKKTVWDIQWSLSCLWELHNNATTQKEFALAIKDCVLSGVLFEARKTGEHPVDVLKRSERQILNYLNW